jgi:hypothetical protein
LSASCVMWTVKVRTRCQVDAAHCQTLPAQRGTSGIA